ncbi:MAG: PilT/PilU family type 4a pilus ATPase [Phycisphaerae bacterium]|nr:PilT/PilU family type 4a pilus ATPase [Phycisphaerae bacterium]
MRNTAYQGRVDADLDQTISRLGARPAPSRRSEIQGILSQAQAKGATDVHIVTGFPILFRIEGELVPVTRGRLDALTARRLAHSMLNSEQIAQFERTLEFDLMMSRADGSRYRVNFSFIDGKVGTVIRLLPSAPLPLEQIRLPAVVSRLPRARKGLILITGGTSQGKTTTLASLIDAINRQHRKNIITIEDPVEYVHAYKNSSVRQRQVGRDTKSFARGLRAALRQDPDVIAIGEMRDYETIKIALTAAATGVLVLSTLHIITIDKIIERLLAYTPQGSEGQIRTLLAEALLCIIHQELLPTVDRKKRVACEVLVATDAVRNLITNRGTFHLRSIIATGGHHGMQSMRVSLDQLREEGVITDSLYRLVLENYR